MKTTPAPQIDAAPIGMLGIGAPRMPSGIDYFPNESIAEYIARAGGRPGQGATVIGWIAIGVIHAPKLIETTGEER